MFKKKDMIQQLEELITEEVRSRRVYTTSPGYPSFAELDQKGCFDLRHPYDYVIALGIALHGMVLDYDNRQTRSAHHRFMKILNRLQYDDLPFITTDALERYQNVSGKPMPCAICHNDKWSRDGQLERHVGVWNDKRLAYARRAYVMHGFIDSELFFGDGKSDNISRWWLSASEKWSLVAAMENPPAEVLKTYAEEAAKEAVIAIQAAQSEITSRQKQLKAMGLYLTTADCMAAPTVKDLECWREFLDQHKG